VFYDSPGDKRGKCGILVGPFSCYGFGVGAFEKCIVVWRGMCWESSFCNDGLPGGVDGSRGWG
jgi:hypothetical protein